MKFVHLPRIRFGERAALLLIVLLAFALRVYRLDAQALWWDESLSVYRATRDLATILSNVILIQNVVTVDTLPQLYFVFLHFLVRAFGTSEFALRFFSLMANVATIPLVYALARRWFTPSPVVRGRGEGVGVLAALLGALSPFYVWYAQEARPYALVLFWSTLAVYALSRAFDHSRIILRLRSELALNEVKEQALHASRWAIVYVLSAAAALYTHYYALFLFPFHAVLIALFVWQTSRARAFILLPAIPLASAIFLFPQVATSVAGNVEGGPAFVPFDIILRDLLNSFSVGITMDWAQAVWIDVALLVLFLLGIQQQAASRQQAVGTRHPSASPSTLWQPFDPSAGSGQAFAQDKAQSRLSLRARLRTSLRITNHESFDRLRTSSRITFYVLRFMLLTYLFIPTLALYLASYIRPLYLNSRHLITISPAFYLGVAAGIAALARWRKWFALPALAIFLIGAAVSLNNLYFDPRFGKDDHRAWAEYLHARVRPGDFLILDSPHAAELFHYYARDGVPWTTLPILRAPSPDADLVAVRDAYRRNARVWFLEMHVPFDDPDARIEQLLQQEGVRLDEVNFRGTSTEISLSLFVRTFPVANVSDIAHPLDIAFGGHLRLRGYDAPESLTPGERGVVKLYWQIDEPVGEDYAVSLRLVDHAGTHWGQWDATPLGNRAGSSTWQPHQIIVDAHDLALAADLRPGAYRLQVVPYHAATGAALGDVVTLGEIQIVVRD